MLTQELRNARVARVKPNSTTRAKAREIAKRRNMCFTDTVFAEMRRQAHSANRSVSNYLATLVMERAK